MSTFYYLLSSLPTLIFERNAPIPYARLEESAKASLGEKELQRFKAFDLQLPPNSLQGLGKIEAAYWGYETSLRNDLVRLRAETLGLKADDYLRPLTGVYNTIEEAREAFRSSNPLKVEESLDKSRWVLLESKKDSNIFSFENLLIYSMQLQLLLRRERFDRESGRLHYEDEYKRTLKSAEAVLEEHI